MSKFKVLEGSWKGHVGEFVRHELENVVLRLESGRLVEFKPERVDLVVEHMADDKAEKAAE